MHAQNVAIIKFPSLPPLSLSLSFSLCLFLTVAGDSFPPFFIYTSCPLSVPGFARKSDGNYRGFKGSASGLGGQFRGNPRRPKHLREGALGRIDTRNSARNWDLKERGTGRMNGERTKCVRPARRNQVQQELLKSN